ncbi:hypothetical protein MPSEU_000037000 [Mayamaea pseudoterrestris]|nr:hypothetical protein MPSEU_000037000 [Mayamaea pseudoterrestris]
MLPFFPLVASIAFCYNVHSFAYPSLTRRIDVCQLSSHRSASAATTFINTKELLLDLLQQAPRGASTPASLTSEILATVQNLETYCPTDSSDVLDKLAGTWTLQWTTQDRTRTEAKNPFAFINPLENQSYSNNPNGRANPVLPRNIQDRLEEIGLIQSDNSQSVIDAPIKSTQTIDIRKQQVINVVSIVLGNDAKRRATLTVTVSFTPDALKARRINVKFQSCRVAIAQTPINFLIPLGPIGPTGWLQTDYIDNDLRITRGNKGSVFILTR